MFAVLLEKKNQEIVRVDKVFPTHWQASEYADFVSIMSWGTEIVSTRVIDLIDEDDGESIDQIADYLY